MKITVYTITDCQFSKAEKEYLKSHNLPYEEKNLETNKEFLTEMLAISNNFAGTPVTRIEKDDGTITVLKGFTPKEFDDVFGFNQQQTKNQQEQTTQTSSSQTPPPEPTQTNENPTTPPPTDTTDKPALEIPPEPSETSQPPTTPPQSSSSPQIEEKLDQVLDKLEEKATSESTTTPPPSSSSSNINETPNNNSTNENTPPTNIPNIPDFSEKNS